jgi:hypothetical protein
VGRVELALEVRVSRAQQRNDDLKGLVEPREDPVLRKPERARLPRPFVAGTQAEDEAAAADLVEARRSWR